MKARVAIGMAGLRGMVFAGMVVRGMVFAAMLLAATAVRGQSYVPEYGGVSMKVAPVVRVAAYPFSIKDVRLLDGPFKVGDGGGCALSAGDRAGPAVVGVPGACGAEAKGGEIWRLGVIGAGRAYVGALSVGLFDGICVDGGCAVQGPGWVYCRGARALSESEGFGVYRGYSAGGYAVGAR